MQETHGGATACGYGAEQASVRDVRERLLARDRCIAADPCIGGRPWGGGSGGGVTRVLCAAVHDFSFNKGVCGACSFAQETARSMGTVLLFTSWSDPLT